MNQSPQLLLLDRHKPICEEGLLEVATAYGVPREAAEALATELGAREGSRFVGVIFTAGGNAWHAHADSVERALAISIARIRQIAGATRCGYVPFLCDADLADESARQRYVKWMLSFEECIQKRIEGRLKGGCAQRAA